jgi:hypothetical protein
MLAALTARAWTWLAAIGAALAVVAGAFLKGRRDATRDARLRQAEQAAEQRTTRDEIDRDVERHDDPAGELRRDWRRP